MGLRERILAANDLRREAVDVPEWGAQIWISMLGLTDRLEYERWSAKQSQDSDELIVRLLVLTATDEDGRRVFTEADAKELAAKNPDVLLRLGQIAARVNRLGAAEVATAKGES